MRLTTIEVSNELIAQVRTRLDAKRNEVDILINDQMVGFFQVRNGRIALQLCDGLDSKIFETQGDEDGFIVAEA
jgi:hypothetical protein